MILGTSAEETRQQGDQGGADQGNATAGHQLYHGELVVKRQPKIKPRIVKFLTIIGNALAISGNALDELKEQRGKSEIDILPITTADCNRRDLNISTTTF